MKKQFLFLFLFLIGNGKSLELFDSPYYSATYQVVGGTPSLSFGADGLVRTPDASDTVEVTINEKATPSGSQPGYATVLLNLPKKETVTSPQFSQLAFTGNYIQGTDTDTVDLKDKITAEIPGTIIDFNEYSDYFNILKNPDDNSYSVIVKKKLNQNVLKAENNIILTLKASITGASDSYAILIVNLPKVFATPSMVFDSLYYSVIYTVLGDKPTLIYDSDGLITTPGASDTLEVTFLESLGSVFFNITRSGDSWNLTPVLALPPVVVHNKQNYILTLKASDPENPELADSFATFIIELPICSAKASQELQVAAFKFSKPFYLANYAEDGNAAVVVLAIPIKISSDHIVEFAFIGDYASNFEFSYQEAVQISVSNILNAGIVSECEEIFLTLQATDKKSLQIETTVIILRFR